MKRLRFVFYLKIDVKMLIFKTIENVFTNIDYVHMKIAI